MTTQPNGIKNTLLGLIIGFSLAGNVYAYQLHTGHVASIQQACVEHTSVVPSDWVGDLQKGKR